MCFGICEFHHRRCPHSLQFRAKSDIANPVLAGSLVGAWLARKQGPLAVAGGAAGFAAFSYVIEWYMHRETEEED
jgi:mitochondrial import inner membrane translocase subunit TIM22